jgi:general secretion pathway protein K
MSDEPTRADDARRGVILLIVLWTVAMMAVIMTALGANVRTTAGLAGSETRRLRTEIALEGGIDVAAAAIISSGDQLRSLSDGHATQIALGPGDVVEMKIRDAAGLIDINRADEALLGSLIAHVTGSADTGKTVAQQISQARTDAVGNADSNPPAFVTLTQLYSIKGIDPDILKKLLPFLGLYSKEGLVNIPAAPDDVIASIPGITPLQIETIANARSRGDWEGSQIQDLADELEDYVSTDPGNIFFVDLNVLQSADLIAGSRLGATILMDQGGDVPYHVLARSW